MGGRELERGGWGGGAVQGSEERLCKLAPRDWGIGGGVGYRATPD